MHDIVLSILTFVVVYGNLVPLSLYVNLEITRLVQGYHAFFFLLLLVFCCYCYSYYLSTYKTFLNSSKKKKKKKNQTAYLFENDLKMYDFEKKRTPMIRATNLMEELGQIDYIFADKTGILILFLTRKLFISKNIRF